MLLLQFTVLFASSIGKAKNVFLVIAKRIHGSMVAMGGGVDLENEPQHCTH